MKNKEGEINGIIYGVRCTANQKWYIGQTIRGIEKRRQEHLKAARNNNCRTYRCVFHNAIRKYGEDAFDWTVLEADIHTYDELNEAEKYWIKEKNARVKDGGYNMNAGGNGSPDHRKEFVRWNKGKTGCYTEEARRRMSEGRRGIPVSEEQRKKISATLTGRRLSEDRIRHAADSHKKPILIFDNDGNFVGEFSSVSAAADYIGISVSNVSMVLTGKTKSAGGGCGNRRAGYTFRYKNENPDR